MREPAEILYENTGDNDEERIIVITSGYADKCIMIKEDHLSHSIEYISRRSLECMLTRQKRNESQSKLDKNFEIEYISFVKSKLAKSNIRCSRNSHIALGLIGEVGELADALKHDLVYQKPLDIENVKEELGDIIYYLFASRVDDEYFDTLKHYNHDPSSIVGLPQPLVVRLNNSVATLSTALNDTHDHSAWSAAKIVMQSEVMAKILDLIIYFDFTLLEVIEANIEKLNKRYSGTFTIAEADQRNDKKSI